MPPVRLPDVRLGLYWDARGKAWTATVTGVDHAEWLRIRTTSAIGQTEAWLLLKAVQREMESWLPAEQA